MNKKLFNQISRLIYVISIMYISLGSLQSLAFSQDLLLYLTNYRDEKEYSKGVPIFLTVVMKNENAIKARELKASIIPSIELARKESRWSNYIYFHIQKQGTRTEKSTQLESLIQSKNLFELNRQYSPYWQKPEDARLSATSFETRLLIPPDITEQMEEGTYVCFVEYNPIGYPIEETTVFCNNVKSNTFTFYITEPKTAQDTAKVLLLKSSYIATYNSGNNNNHEEALKLVLKAATVAPDLQDIHLTLAGRYREVGRYNDSLSEFQMYLKYLESINCNEDKSDDVLRIKMFIEEVQAKIDRTKLEFSHDTAQPK